ncbi:hypothetical protein MTO96_047262 [Rhipicephalus appendiculatus]
MTGVVQSGQEDISWASTRRENGRLREEVRAGASDWDASVHLTRGEAPDVELPVDQVLATAAGEYDKNATEDSATEGGDTSAVAEEAAIVHARDNENKNAVEVLVAEEDRDARDEPRATLLVRANYNDDSNMGVAEEDQTIAARASGRTEKLACTTTRTTAEATAENEPVYDQWQDAQDGVDGKEGNIASEADDGDEGRGRCRGMR